MRRAKGCDSAPARIVNVASRVHEDASLDFDDLQNKKRYSAMGVYGQSKLANILFTYELARKLDGTGVTVNALHPGVVRTNIARAVPVPLNLLVKLVGLFLLSPEKGAETTLELATSPSLEGATGGYYVKKSLVESSAESRDAAVAKRLWDLSAEMTHCAS